MDHWQRPTTTDSSNAPSNVFSTSMPNVLFREIHKNAFLKRHSSDRRTGFPRKSERVWVVFCVHDDVEPFLEIYPDQKVALTHKPEWFASLSNALHVSPTICGHEDEFEFAVTLSFQVVRLAAPSWESMMEWVETIRNKLRELKVLCPKENVYSKMPEQKQPLLPTRDPNSPLPLPPEGPSTLLPGVELVHVQSRNGSISQDSGDNGRHQRDAETRNNASQLRQVIKRRNERDNRIVTDTPQRAELPGSSINASENFQEMNGEEVNRVSINSGLDLHKKKTRVKRAASVPQATPSTSQITSGSNVTVIEVSTAGNRENHSASEFNLTDYPSDSDGADADDVFYSASSEQMKSNVKNVESNDCGDEAHYERVFLSSIPINKPQLPKIMNSGPKIAAKAHSTNMMINSNNSTVISSSLNENGPSTSASIPPIQNVNSVEIRAGISSSGNLSKNSSKTEKTDPIATDREEIQTKLEKVNISGLIPRIPGKSSKQGISKSSANPNIGESRKCSIESLPARDPNLSSEGRNLTRLEISENGKGNSSAAYSQVVKVPSVKTKAENVRNSVKINSPVFPKKKKIPCEIQIVGEEVESRTDPSGNVGNDPSRNPNRMTPPEVNTNLGVVNVDPSRECIRNASERNESSSNEIESRPETIAPAPSTSVPNRTDRNPSKKDSTNCHSNDPEVEPMTATVQPAVGVIAVEDIPLIGGHQRRRRRSCSSDNAISGPNNPSSSRGLVGADRIRINVGQASNLTPSREEPRCEMEAGNVADQIVHGNVSRQCFRMTLREQQVLRLKKEMLHPGGVRLQLRRKDCTGSIALVDVINGVWVAGWKQKEHPLLYNALHIGDQLISVGDIVVRNSSDAQKLIRNSTSLHVEFIIRRIPFGNVFALQKSVEGQNLGIVQEGNTAEIKEVVANGLAARHGLTMKTLSHDGSSLTNWYLTEINGRPLNLFFKDNEVRDRLNAVGKEISILVQPHDFVKQIKKQLKNIRGYKDYIVQ